MVHGVQWIIIIKKNILQANSYKLCLSIDALASIYIFFITLDVSCGGDICFYLDFATQGGGVGALSRRFHTLFIRSG